MTQQEFMRNAIRSGKTRHQSAIAWAEAEKAGTVMRRSNTNKMSAYDYGLALWADVRARLAGTKGRKS